MVNKSCYFAKCANLSSISLNIDMGFNQRSFLKCLVLLNTVLWVVCVKQPCIHASIRSCNGIVAHTKVSDLLEMCIGQLLIFNLLLVLGCLQLLNYLLTIPHMQGHMHLNTIKTHRYVHLHVCAQWRVLIFNQRPG